MSAGDLALKALKDWQNDPGLRVEFQDNFNRYAAYIRNTLIDRAKIYSGNQ